MKKSIRCCISCILPCGALDVIRIVHASGRVEVIGGGGRIILADEIMRAYPKHVLRKPQDGGGDGPRAVVVPPGAELHRGSIYFLTPVAVASSANKEKSSSSTARRRRRRTKAAAMKMKTEEGLVLDRSTSDHSPTSAAEEDQTRLLMSEKVSTRRDRRRGRVAVWLPRLESISETTND